MNPLIPDIDHLMCGVVDPQQAGATFERLGFTVSPLSVIKSLGLANRCILFHSPSLDHANYLELLGVVDPSNASSAMAARLAGPEGV